MVNSEVQYISHFSNQLKINFQEASQRYKQMNEIFSENLHSYIPLFHQQMVKIKNELVDGVDISVHSHCKLEEMTISWPV
jgi:hypothetical protein